jgi:hypothetical protein
VSGTPSSGMQNPSEKLNQVDEKPAAHKQEEKSPELKQDEKISDSNIGETSVKTLPIDKGSK